MHVHPDSRRRTLALLSSLVLAVAAPAWSAEPKPKPAAVKAKKAAVAELRVPDAQPDQVKAAELVFYGTYDCEFKQVVHIVQSPKYSAYVDVSHGKSAWLMKPVLSSTGAIRLEDVRGETLMVQIAAKSMLLNVKIGQRIVDDCISPKQRELTEAAKAAKAAEAASAPAGGTSSPAAAGNRS